MRKEGNDPLLLHHSSHSSNSTSSIVDEVNAPVRKCNNDIPLIVVYSTTKTMEATTALTTAVPSAGQSTTRSSSSSKTSANNKRKVSNADDHERSTISSITSHPPPKKRFCQRKEAATGKMLLAQPGDEEVLNPLHCFIRRQIEVFEATPKELAQPSPGRKVPIKLRQVGLRCIHCTTTDLTVKNNGNDSPKKRVKRAVCYPSSVARVYHSVSDMKFDHFGQCNLLPTEVRETFERLKMEAGASQKRPSSSLTNKKKKGSSSGSGSKSPSSTGQYYHESAVRMGMVDGPDGIFMNHNVAMNVPSPAQLATDTLIGRSAAISPAQNGKATKMVSPVLSEARDLVSNTEDLLPLTSNINSLLQQYQQQKQNVEIISTNVPCPSSVAPSSNVRHTHVTENHSPKNTQVICPDTQGSTNHDVDRPPRAAEITTTIPLSDPDDVDYLNPLHCFVRRHIEFFVADSNACSAPSPGRKSRVVVGQVGLRCIHCANLPTTQRVKRSICYPPSIAGIYHAVSNMKFDHFAICKGLPQASREEFTTLRNSCSRRGTAAGNNNCTCQKKNATTQTPAAKSNKKLKFGKSNSSSDSSTGSSGVSTGQYYSESAVNKGLVDSDIGIRFVGSGGDVRRSSMGSSQDLKDSTSVKNNDKDTKSRITTTSHASSSIINRNLTGLSALVMAASQAAA